MNPEPVPGNVVDEAREHPEHFSQFFLCQVAPLSVWQIAEMDIHNAGPL